MDIGVSIVVLPRASISAILLAMARSGIFGGFSTSKPRKIVFTLAVLLFAKLVHAQDNSTPFRLHVYSNLFQIPTLVLSDSRRPLPPIPPERFRIRIDGGKPFLPRAVRQEGDDPISLSVLLDLSGTQKKIVPELAVAFAALQKESLRPQDHVYLFAVDCKLIRNVRPLAGDAPELESAVRLLINSLSVHGQNRTTPHCGSSVHFTDSLAAVMQRTSELPGRRVVLAVANGYDSGSHLNITDLRTLATRFAVTLFALSDQTYDYPPEIAAFSLVCENSGGVALRTKPETFTHDLQTFLAMIRHRYIVEFTRQQNMNLGSHTIAIELAKMSAFIRPAGTTAVSLDHPESSDDLKHTPESPAPTPQNNQSQP